MAKTSTKTIEEKDGKVRHNLRMPPEETEHAKIMAQEDDRSLNGFLTKLVRERWNQRQLKKKAA